MQFMPFHMGPGPMVKAAGRRYFSLTLFALIQVAIDLEPLVHVMRGDARLHGWAHTYLGATVVPLAAAVVGRSACQYLLTDLLISRPAALSGALIGGWSRVTLDSLMHADVRPWAPFSTANQMLGLVLVPALHLYLCRQRTDRAARGGRASCVGARAGA